MNISKIEDDGRKHPLLTREIRPIKDWTEWLERWQAAVSLEEMMGLLHCGFDINFRYSKGVHDPVPYSNDDRTSFYFQIADGWAWHYGMLRLETDPEETFPWGFNSSGFVKKLSLSEMRQVVAEKAFAMLCLNFFRSDGRATTRSDHFMNSWEKNVANELLFPVILNFFHAEVDKWGVTSIPNLGSIGGEVSHNKQLAINFLIDFTLFLWEWRSRKVDMYSSEEDRLRKEKQNARLTTQVAEGKLLMIEVFAAMKKLDHFEVMWGLKLDEACLAKLLEIALRAKINHGEFEKSTRVKTLDEACYAGSHAAWFLKRYEIRKAVQLNLDARKQAAERLRVARREVEQLSSPVS